MAAQSQDRIVLNYEPSQAILNLEYGLLKGNNPAAFKRLLSLASLNAVRTMVKPMRDEAPVGRTTPSPGRLRKSVTARRGRYQIASGVVGPRAGRNRGSGGGAWYRWFVTSGISGVRQTKNGAKSVKAVPANPFVMRVAKNSSNQARAMEAFSKTVEAYFNNEAFRNTILRFKRGR
jgi:hypothetical protein